MPNKVTVKLVGDKELEKKIMLLATRVNGAVRKGAEAGAKIIEDAAERDAPGPFIASGNEKVIATGTVEISIGPDKEHWEYQFVETGATRHEIAAGKKKGAPYLVFEGRKGLVVTKKVQHPGMAARPFLRPAMKQQKDAAVAATGKVFRAEIDKLVINGGD